MNIEYIKLIAETAKNNRYTILNEEATKHALILPLLQALGYDIFNPNEVIPEYKTEHGRNVDYAIIIENEPVIIIEAKACKTNLTEANVSQLYGYFSVNKAKYAILTNGIEYRIYTNENATGLMKPLCTIDMRNIGKSELIILTAFSKKAFSCSKFQLTDVNLESGLDKGPEDTEKNMQKKSNIKSTLRGTNFRSTKFRSKVDILLIARLYLEGSELTDIKKTIGDGITKQGIMDRLIKLGLLGHREDWAYTTRKPEELEYMKRNNIEGKYDQFIKETIKRAREVLNTAHVNTMTEHIKTTCKIAKTSGAELSDVKTIQIVYPELYKEIDTQKNRDIDIAKITTGSGRKIDWNCNKCGHKWSTKARSRINSKSGCTECGYNWYYREIPSRWVNTLAKDIKTAYPELYKEIDKDMNERLHISKIERGFHILIDWKCEKCKHTWKVAPKSRTLHKSGCPNCGYNWYTGKTNTSRAHNARRKNETLATCTAQL